jgi:hypothetical protein
MCTSIQKETEAHKNFALSMDYLSRIIYGYFICLTKKIFGKEGSLHSKMKSIFSSSEIAYFKLPCHIWYDAKVLS